jgi:hypothetical protein
MATPTYDLLESVTLATAASSVTFSSIDQSYGDLIFSTETQISAASGDYRVRFNSNTGSVYSWVLMRGDGSSTSSFATTTDDIRLQGDDQGVGQTELANLTIMDYSATDKHKSVLVRSGNTDVSVAAVAARYASTDAITTVAFSMSNGANFLIGSTWNLYGIAKTVV